MGTTTERLWENTIFQVRFRRNSGAVASGVAKRSEKRDCAQSPDEVIK